MAIRDLDLEGLLSLPSLTDADARRAAFRTAMASISRAAEDGSSPLDGVSPPALVRALKTAIGAGLLDDLEWLAPASVGVALYEIGAALSPSPEKREVGRRAFGLLVDGRAEVFAAIASRMALGARSSSLATTTFRSRVGVLLALPISNVDVGRLAYALVTRRQHVRDWVIAPSTGSLPSRRVAAQLLERASLEAARRAAAGDELAPRLLSGSALSAPFGRLLADREPLVWRHAAAARGVLSSLSRATHRMIAEALSPKNSPTEWRRAGVSLVASIATDPVGGLARTLELVRGPLAERDAGLVSTLILGLPIVLATEPEAARELLAAIVANDPLRAADPLLGITRDVEAGILDDELQVVHAALTERLSTGPGLDPAEAALIHALREEIESALDSTLRGAVRDAAQAYVTEGAREAHLLAIEAEKLAARILESLEKTDELADAMSLRMTVASLRDVDGGLLDSGLLEDLLQLPRRPADHRNEGLGPLDEIRERLGKYLLDCERTVQSQGATTTSLAMSGRRLRAWLRLLDADSTSNSNAEDENEPRAASIRSRRMTSAHLLLERLRRDDPQSPLRRTVLAALARGLDAQVRDGISEPIDVLLAVGARLPNATDVRTLAEASMDPEVEANLVAWSRFVLGPTTQEGVEPSREHEARANDPDVDRLLDLAQSLGDDGSGRAEGLRGTLVRLGRSLERLTELKSRTKDSLQQVMPVADALARSVFSFLQMEQGASARVLGLEDLSRRGQPANLATSLMRSLEDDSAEARAAFAEFEATLVTMPSALADVVLRVTRTVQTLPLFAPSNESSARIAITEEPLPAWLGARRTIGGFYIVRPLGNGAAASVFIAKRTEERMARDAELFALKVPDYDGAAARQLSEREFNEFFRAEATALLGLPAAPNLARFVTFDLAARPKPILVMELISGATLERWLSRRLSHRAEQPHTCGEALAILDGIAAGLEVMHQHGIGHLDVKPSNAILRDERTPALVDFGLSGRHVRPGCATGSYGAPEVWGVLPDDFRGAASPLPVDVYALGALMFEILSGTVLFDAETEVGIIGQHCAHDGHPRGLTRIRHVRPMTELIEHTLRRDPRRRWTIPQVRAALRALEPHLKALPWPMVAPD